MRKRFLTFVSACILSLLLLCHSWPAPGALRALRAGAATSEITPPLDVVLDGMIMQIGPGKRVHDPLLARCLVLDDGDTRLAIAICDLTMIGGDIVDATKARLQKSLGLPPERVLISATHTHSSPRAVEMGLGVANARYHQALPVMIAAGIERAVKNLAPAAIAWGSTPKPEFVFNRRSYVKPGLEPPNPFGDKTDVVAMGASPAAFIKPSGPVDPELSVVSVRHADGRPLAMLANYSLHYIGGVPAGDISADYFGYFATGVRDLLGLDEASGFVSILSNGTSGDVNGVDPTKLDRPRPGYERMKFVADGLARAAVGVVSGLKHQTKVKLDARLMLPDLKSRQPDAARLQWAREQLATIKPGARLTRPQVYAKEALGLADYPECPEIPLQCFRIGDLAIAAAPCEVFAITGLAIKRDSPFKATFTIELANGYGGYLPTPEQHALGGYETWNARSSFLETTAEPKIRDALLRLMRGLRQAGD